jgi:hypothetical protein
MIASPLASTLPLLVIPSAGLALGQGKFVIYFSFVGRIEGQFRGHVQWNDTAIFLAFQVSV